MTCSLADLLGQRVHRCRLGAALGDRSRIVRAGRLLQETVVRIDHAGGQHVEDRLGRAALLEYFIEHHDAGAAAARGEQCLGVVGADHLAGQGLAAYR